MTAGFLGVYSLPLIQWSGDFTFRARSAVSICAGLDRICNRSTKTTLFFLAITQYPAIRLSRPFFIAIDDNIVNRPMPSQDGTVRHKMKFLKGLAVHRVQFGSTSVESLSRV